MNDQQNYWTSQVSKPGVTESPFPGGTSGKDPTCQRRRHKRGGFDPWVGKIPCRRARQSTPVFLPGESHGQGSLAGYSPWRLQESTQLKQLSRHLGWELPGVFQLSYFFFIGKTLSNINHSRILYDPPSRILEIKAKINKWDLIKSFCTTKETISKVKSQPSEWEKIIANEATDKQWIPKIYKQLLQLNFRKINDSIKN